MTTTTTLKHLVATTALTTILSVSSSSSFAANLNPNFIIVLMDDISAEMFDYMPFLQTHRATAFREYRHQYHVVAQCAPSRASLLTGMYAPRHGVVGNKLPNGGYHKFMSLGLQYQSWSYLLQNAGYQTGLFGKSLNESPDPLVDASFPEGWTRWFGMYDQKKFQNYWMNDQGTPRYYGSGDQNYITKVLLDASLEFINTNNALNRPYALLFSPQCPHTPATPSAEHINSHAQTPFEPATQPGWNAPNVSDKPGYIQQLPLLSQTTIDKMTTYWRRGLECLQWVDRALEQMFVATAANTNNNNTYFIVAGDNGRLMGHYRLDFTKGRPYRASMRTPMFVSGPTITPGIDPINMVTLADILPTLMELAGLPTPPQTDGRSLVPTFSTHNIPWRKVLRLTGTKNESSEITNDGRGFRSLITRQCQYTRYHHDPIEREYYRLLDDPWQTTNLASTLPLAYTEAADMLVDALAGCSGTSCQLLENTQPPLCP